MPWSVEFTDEFETWWNGLDKQQQVQIDARIGLLEQLGPQLGYPHSSGIEGSRHAHMRELRIQYRGHPIRVFYAFDPRRIAILLIGGDKTGNDRFYDEMVPMADRLYDEHLAELEPARKPDG
jgi:hypothetical protein